MWLCPVQECSERVQESRSPGVQSKSPGDVLSERRRAVLLLVDGLRHVLVPRVEGLGIPKRIDTGAPARHGVPVGRPTSGVSGSRQVPWEHQCRYVLGLRGLGEQTPGEDVVRPHCQQRVGGTAVYKCTWSPGMGVGV